MPPGMLMKTMLNLLTHLIELRRCCERAGNNPQLSAGEKAAPRRDKARVRERLPAAVIATYDRMKQTDTDLLDCPELFAMAVLVSAYRSSSPSARRTLCGHAKKSAAPRHRRVTRAASGGK